MQIKGQLHRITNLKAFAASFLQTNGKPTTGFAPFGAARVHLATDFLGGFGGGFLPPMALKTTANAQGAFSFTVADGHPTSNARLLAFRETTVPPPLPGMPPLPVLDPIYRSAPFKLGDVSPQEQQAVQHIYVHLATTPTERGVSQADLNAQVAKLKGDLKLDRLRATIQSAKVSVSAERQGGDVKFSAFVRGSTSSDLGRVIEVKAGEIDIDLPGPDFIVGLCVDEDEIEEQIRKGLRDLSKRVSQELLAALDQEAPGLSSLASVSVWRSRFVQTGEKLVQPPVAGAPPVRIPIFTYVPDAAFGAPRALY
jgi:hypothetical protein